LKELAKKNMLRPQHRSNAVYVIGSGPPAPHNFRRTNEMAKNLNVFDREYGLLINGEFGYRDNVATNTSAFIGDFDIKYLFVPNGNMALNFYNRANDRYSTRNSLNTQGLGVIIKKVFTYFKELFKRKKKKKKEPQKQ